MQISLRRNNLLSLLDIYCLSIFSPIHSAQEGASKILIQGEGIITEKELELIQSY